jgi:integrase
LHDGFYGKSLKTKSKTEAEARLKQYNRGKFGLKPIPTVGEYYKQWIETKVPPLVRPSAAKDYKTTFNAHILPRFRHVSLAALDHAEIADFRNRLMGGRSIKTVKNIISTFRSMYADAQRDHTDLQGRQPFALKWQRQIKERPDPFTAAERDKILTWWRENDFFYFPWVYVLFHTGMRPSELAGLHWSDVDLERRTLSINKSRTHHQDQPTKTAKSVRRIEVGDDILRLIEILPSRKLGIDHVFVNKEGRPINAKKWSEHNWAEPLKKLRIRHRKFYATRHTFITEMVKAGRMIKAIADYVGTSMTMIENNYAGVLSMEPDREIFVKSKKENGEMIENTAEKMVAGPGFEPGTSRL